ncbi:hypothetical protein B0T25DRAFT_253367 [Lasiosphaeria hispida]|uniref:Uncharacterized protein n=1 Tax=Lasiosphaeria hispida TaxID=260671 RepID=A0AAJ0HG39_9PEZI|nr:hypothetical protein B0T25DRAFT_253367 [Lasiosphaeria hispida]
MVGSWLHSTLSTTCTLHHTTLFMSSRHHTHKKAFRTLASHLPSLMSGFVSFCVFLFHSIAPAFRKEGNYRQDRFFRVSPGADCLVYYIDCAWDRRRSAHGGNVRRSIAVLICSPEEGAAWRPKREKTTDGLLGLRLLERLAQRTICQRQRE